MRTRPPEAGTRFEPLERVEWPGAAVWVRGSDRAWIAEAMEAGESMADWVSRRSDGRALGGRGPAVLTGTPAGPRVLRRYIRGGFAAPFLGDRYLALGESRPAREIRVSEKLRSVGVRTPEITAAAVYPVGAFLRAELMTRYVDDSVTLRAALEAGPSAQEPNEALLAAGALVAQLARVGLHHPDLHAENVLIRRNGGGPEAWVLDLDRCSFPGVNRPAVRLAALRGRLLRSLDKWWGRAPRTALTRFRSVLDRGIADAW